MHEKEIVFVTRGAKQENRITVFLATHYSSVIKQYLHKNSGKFVSKWVILLLDMSFVLASFLFAYLLRFNFDLARLADEPWRLHLALTVLAFGIGFLIFRPFAGIIRHSSLKDLEAIVFATFTGLGLTLSLYAFAALGSVVDLIRIPLSILFIHFFVLTFLMGATRFFIRAFYKNIVQKRNDVVRVAIYGAGQLGRMTKHVLEQDTQRTYEVIAFLDDNDSLIGKKIEGLPVHSPEKATSQFLSANRIQELILAIQKIDPDKKRSIIDRFLQEDIIIKNIPAVDQWINGELSSMQIKQININDLLEREPIHLDHVEVKEQLKDRVVLVTGAAGSIGSEIVRQVLHYEPKELILVDQAESPLHELLLRLKESFNGRFKRVVTYIADVTNKERIDQIFERHKPAIVYHAAAYKHVPLMEDNAYEAIGVNVLGTYNIGVCCAQHATEHMVLVSTDKAVNPTNVMGASKRMAELTIQFLQAKFSNTHYIATRFGNVLGSNGSVIPLFQRQIDKGGPVTVTHPDITRFFMTIPEACELVLEAGAMGQGGEVFVFDMGEPVKVLELAKKMIRLSGQTEQEIPIHFVGLRPGEKLYEEVLGDTENTKPTYNSKIRVAQIQAVNVDTIEQAIMQFPFLLKSGDDYALVRKLKQLIPEFKSNNSIFQSLDQHPSRKQQA